MRRAKMLKLALTWLGCILVAVSVVAGGKDAAAAPPGAQALQGTSSSGIRQDFVGCPVNAGDFGPVPTGKVQSVCGM